MSEEHEEGHHGGHHWKIIAFIAFAGILGLLIFTSFYDFPLTGKITGVNSNNSVDFHGELSIPNFEVVGNFEKVEIRGGSDSFFYVEGEKFQMNSKNSYIILSNYTGEIFFNGEKISKLNGKAAKVVMNGVPIEPKSKANMKVSFEKEFPYSFLNIQNKAMIKKLSYVSSGKIDIDNGKSLVNLENNELNIQNFEGNIKVEKNVVKMIGSVQKLEIDGKTKFSIMA